MDENVKTDIRALNFEELTTYFMDKGYKKFRAQQVYDWIWKRGAIDFNEMTNISKDLRKELQESFELPIMSVDKVQKSSDGTIKSRLKLRDGYLIEAVLIPVDVDGRYTVCVSSQVGCSLSCSFCATGKMDRIRNLTVGEIYDQIRIVNAQCQEHFGCYLTNVVYMGMGEPLLNYNNVVESIRCIMMNEDWNLTPKKFTISTAGIAKMIRKLGDEGIRLNLALSLHAAHDEKRNEIMPINETNNLTILEDALAYFYGQVDSKITYEYILFDEFNDDEKDAAALAKICRKYPVKVNIIEYNKVDGVTMNKASEKRLTHFVHSLRNKNVYATVRRSRGKDIDAACGQLANK